MRRSSVSKALIIFYPRARRQDPTSGGGVPARSTPERYGPPSSPAFASAGGPSVRDTTRAKLMARTLTAVNTAPDSENRMHGDEARRYGFAAGLVPGVEVLAYIAHEGVVRWGADWLSGGRLQGRLDAPVYDGELVEVDATEGTDGLEVVVRGSDGGARARATLSALLPGARAEVQAGADPEAFAVRLPPGPADRAPASRELLEPGTVLATQHARFHSARAMAYLDEISETDPAFRIEGLAHPGWLLRFANWALSSTVRLGPWIHVSSDAWLLAAVRDGDQLEVRAVVTDRFEAKGHEFVDLRVLFLVDGRPVALVDHRAIWQPRTRP